MSGWQILRFQLLQPDKLPLESTFGKISIYIYSIFQCTILLGLFSSFILAAIIRPQLEIDDPMRNMVSSLKRGDYYLVANDPNAWFYEKVNNSNDDIYIQIRQALRVTPLKVVPDREEALNLVANDNAFLFQQVDEWSYYRAKASCDVIALEKYMDPVEAHLMMRQEHPLIDQIDNAIDKLKIKLNGISSKYERWANSFNQCPPRDQHRPLQLTPYIGLCIVCVFICGIALCVLVIEMLMAQIRNNNNSKFSLIKRIN